MVSRFRRFGWHERGSKDRQTRQTSQPRACSIISLSLSWWPSSFYGFFTGEEDGGHNNNHNHHLPYLCPDVVACLERERERRRWNHAASSFWQRKDKNTYTTTTSWRNIPAAAANNNFFEKHGVQKRDNRTRLAPRAATRIERIIIMPCPRESHRCRRRRQMCVSEWVL